MGAEPFSVVVHYQRGSASRIDFRNYDRALRFATQRASTPLVTRTEIVHDHQMVWTSIKGVIAETNH